MHNAGRLPTMAEAANLPESARTPIRLLAEQFRNTKMKIEDVTAEIRVAAESDATPQRLRTIPGVGLIKSSVLAATVPDVTSFRTARDLAAWIGLAPKPHSSGGYIATCQEISNARLEPSSITTTTAATTRD